MEGQLHDANSFVTLTYADENLPEDYGLHVEHLQKFMKRLRKRIAPDRVRYVACGEYGDENQRPHYHAVIFGFDFSEDRYLWRISPAGHNLYRSPLLETLWPLGNSEVGSVTKESGDYVARYVMKKIGGAMAEEHYRRVNPLSGKTCLVSPEFLVMSNRPGIASGWFDKFESDVFPGDFIVVNGTRMPTPRYFSKKLEGRNADEGSLLKEDDLTPMRRHRKEVARSLADNSTPERLLVREKVREARVASLKRNL